MLSFIIFEFPPTRQTVTNRTLKIKKSRAKTISQLIGRNSQKGAGHMIIKIIRALLGKSKALKKFTIKFEFLFK